MAFPQGIAFLADHLDRHQLDDALCQTENKATQRTEAAAEHNQQHSGSQN